MIERYEVQSQEPYDANEAIYIRPLSHVALFLI